MTCATSTVIPCWGARDSMPYAALSPSSHVEEIIHYATLSPPSHVEETIHYATLSPPSHVEETIHYATLSPPFHVEERGILCRYHITHVLHCHHHPNTTQHTIITQLTVLRWAARSPCVPWFTNCTGKHHYTLCSHQHCDCVGYWRSTPFINQHKILSVLALSHFYVTYIF